MASPKEIELRHMCEVTSVIDPAYRGEPPWTVYYWLAFTESGRQERDGVNSMTFTITARDRRIFTELSDTKSIMVYEEDNGAIHTVRVNAGS